LLDLTLLGQPGLRGGAVARPVGIAGELLFGQTGGDDGFVAPPGRP